MIDTNMVAVEHSLRPENDWRYVKELEALMAVEEAIRALNALENKSELFRRSLDAAKLWNLLKVWRKVHNAIQHYKGEVLHDDDVVALLEEWSPEWTPETKEDEHD